MSRSKKRSSAAPANPISPSLESTQGVAQMVAENAEKPSLETTHNSTAAGAAAAPIAVPTIEAEGLQALYANFARVSPAPEELVLEFGLNPNLPGANPPRPVKVAQRLVLNYYTAKRLWAALSLAVQRHEQAFGTLETDVAKRVVAPRNGH
jgi:hypothetical protein